MASIRSRLEHAWNAFLDQDDARWRSYGEASTYGTMPDRTRPTVSNERTIVTSVYNHIAVDVGSVDIRHVRLDEDERYLEDIKSGLNSCLTLQANIDQAATEFRHNIVMTMLEKGVAAIVPVDTTINPQLSGSFDIQTMRVGEITAWHPTKVTVSLYNEARGMREDITVDKKIVAVVVNPFFDIMNTFNANLKRLTLKLGMLDKTDDMLSSGKLDLIIQLPYTIKSEARRQQAEQRRTDIEFQLKGSKYGIAYADSTEKITQLNRPVENNLLKQVEYLTNRLYNELGITEAVMNGTADEKAMINYYTRTVEPILTAIVEAMRPKFLTKTGRTQGQTIMYFRNPFKLTPIAELAEITDKFTRNEVLSANEVRQGIGFKPSKDPKADELRNSNMPQVEPTAPGGDTDMAQGVIAEMNKSLDDLFNEIGASP
jgi:hypothetical protein